MYLKPELSLIQSLKTPNANSLEVTDFVLHVMYNHLLLKHERQLKLRIFHQKAVQLVVLFDDILYIIHYTLMNVYL